MGGSASTRPAFSAEATLIGLKEGVVGRCRLDGSESSLSERERLIEVIEKTRAVDGGRRKERIRHLPVNLNMAVNVDDRGQAS